jgi:hypothetical protein
MLSLVETAPPMWSTWREALVVIAYRPHLVRTLRIAAIVGTILFAINQLDVVLHGHATALVWFKVGLTYCVPFCVSNLGILVATNRRRIGS